MPKIIYIAFDGTRNEVDVPAGQSVMSGATENAVGGIVGECGGFCSCATCHVYVDDAWLAKLPAMTEHEDEMLEGTAAERRANSRLSCQINVAPELDGMIIHTPEIQNI
jgi:2Fe-2S ferredoxin